MSNKIKNIRRLGTLPRPKVLVISHFYVFFPRKLSYFKFLTDSVKVNEANKIAKVPYLSYVLSERTLVGNTYCYWGCLRWCGAAHSSTTEARWHPEIQTQCSSPHRCRTRTWPGMWQRPSGQIQSASVSLQHRRQSCHLDSLSLQKIELILIY